MNESVAMLEPLPSNDGILYYQQWFVEAWRDAGGRVVARRNIIPHAVCAVLGRCWPGIRMFGRRRRLIVPSSGRTESASWPALLANEIVPMLWDVWPHNIDPLVRFSRRHGVRTILCTSSQSVERLRCLLPSVNVVWMPEGIKVDAYPVGPKLVERPLDILSYGRQMPGVMDKLRAMAEGKRLDVLFRKGSEHLFADFGQLVCGLQRSKITICYPQSVTHPEHAYETETLTQRYWEAMLTGTVPAGHAPKELVDFCGYNPVVELGDEPCQLIERILADIGGYQDLVDRNRRCAEKIAGWENRMPIINMAMSQLT